MRYEIYENNQGLWRAGLLLAALMLIGGRFAFQLYLDHKLDTAQAQWNIEIEKAQARAQAEQHRLAILKVSNNKRSDESSPKDFELIRSEAHLSHLRYQESLAQAAREREQIAQQARSEKERQQQTAAASARNQIAALQRALAMPMPR